MGCANGIRKNESVLSKRKILRENPQLLASLLPFSFLKMQQLL